MDSFLLFFTITLSFTAAVTVAVAVYSFCQSKTFEIRIHSSILIILGLSLIGSLVLQIYYIVLLDVNYNEVLCFQFGEGLNSISILELFNLFNWQYIGKRGFQMPFKECLNPTTTNKYWLKINLILGSILLCNAILQEVFTYELNLSTKYDFNLSLGNLLANTMLMSYILSLNIMSLRATMLFKKFSKETIKKLGNIFITLAIINIVSLSLSNIVACATLTLYTFQLIDLSTKSLIYEIKDCVYAYGELAQSVCTYILIRTLRKVAQDLKMCESNYDFTDKSIGYIETIDNQPKLGEVMHGVVNGQ